MRIGPTFVKIGKAVLYPTDELDAWDQKNMVPPARQRDSGWLAMMQRDDHAGAQEHERRLPIAAPKLLRTPNILRYFQ
jgi:hypothetical protein